MLDPLHNQDKATLLRIRQTLGEQVSYVVVMVEVEVMAVLNVHVLADITRAGYPGGRGRAGHGAEASARVRAHGRDEDGLRHDSSNVSS